MVLRKDHLSLDLISYREWLDLSYSLGNNTLFVRMARYSVWDNFLLVFLYPLKRSKTPDFYTSIKSFALPVVTQRIMGEALQKSGHQLLNVRHTEYLLF